MKKTKKTVPVFETLRDEARFWDTHDVTDYLGEFKIVEGVYATPDETKTTMTIRLAPSLKEKIEKLAKSYDISASSLIRMWVVDKLRNL